MTSFIGQATGTTSATLPAHVAGDLIVAFAFRDGSNTVPTLPAGWTDHANSGANTCSARVAYKYAASSSETSGTWTSATSVIFAVYRSTNAILLGAVAVGGAASTTVNYPALTLQDTSGSSWVAAFSGHRSVDTNLQNAPTGMTARSTVVDATDEAAGFDTNGGVTSWTSQNVSVAGTSSGWRSYVVEIREIVGKLLIANGDFNNAAIWNPIGIPTSSNIIKILRSFTLTIPTAYTAQCAGGSFSGISTTLRATIIVNGVLEIYGTMNQQVWTTLSLVGGSIDLRGNAWYTDYSGTTKRCEVLSSGSTLNKIWSSTTKGFFGGIGNTT